jgi:P27 family predicted phage terminase small subunit
MGRKRTATIVKLAKGTFKTSDAPKNEPKYQAPEDLTVPATINAQGPGARKWRELAPHLASRGCLTDVDKQNLEAYCMAYETMLRAHAEIEKADSIIIVTDKGNQVQHPAVTVLGTATGIMQRYSGMLGLDPASRTKIEGKPPGGSAKSFSDLAK